MYRQGNYRQSFNDSISRAESAERYPVNLEMRPTQSGVGSDLESHLFDNSEGGGMFAD